MSEKKSCPFCNAPVVEHPAHQFRTEYVYIEHKEDCYLKFMGSDLAISDLKEWNTRTPERTAEWYLERLPKTIKVKINNNLIW